MRDCIFCKIVAGEIPSVMLWEDDDHVAILDVAPNTRGMTLVLTKKHYASNISFIDDDVFKRFMIASKRVVRVLEKGLSVSRVALVVEGTGVNHAHAKLYPLHGVLAEFHSAERDTRTFFDTYQGFVSTQLGPNAQVKELKMLAQEIRRKSGEEGQTKLLDA
ncbi:diadenosine tetraphosphate hydrolase [archaeon CG10_big_fil_rev_8_21_14_0_10_43_11]|nr:MAG: diadenosine tetraphosphate hydrolase [archaeon CG10_big_fil_rev_8_21_14_0_10_43_11]